MRSQVEQARHRQYPDAADIPAKWLAVISGRLKSIEVRLNQLRESEDRDLKAEGLLVEINACYDDLQVLAHADATQVADFVVRPLRRWFRHADPDCDYLFTSGINFELEPLYDTPPPETYHRDYENALAQLPIVLYRVTMPGGALGAGFHVPLVTHELGHVLILRLARQNTDELIKALGEPPPEREEHQEAYGNWIDEVVADTICGFVAGPAGFFALHEKLRGGDTPTVDYPHNHIRVSSLGTYIKERFGSVFAAHQIKDSDWAGWPIRSERELLEAASKHGEYESLSRRLITSLPQIREVAENLARQYIFELEYTRTHLFEDLNAHLQTFLYTIPPFETRGDLRHRLPTDLSSILNVGWFIAAFALDKLRIKVPHGPMRQGQLLVFFDQLILKAIELSEFRREWTNA